MGIHIMVPLFMMVKPPPGYGGPVTAYFYPDPDPEVTSVDGFLESRGLPRPQNWAYVRAGNVVAPSDASPDGAIMIYCDIYANMWYSIDREIELYDTSSIPEGSIIDDAKLRILGDHKVTDVLFPNAGIVVVTSNPASNTGLIDADWNTFGATMLTDIISQDDFNAAGYNTFTFTPDGLAAIIPAGITKLGLIESGYDLPNIEPPWGSRKRTLLRWKSADNSYLPDKPRLEVTYRPPL